LINGEGVSGPDRGVTNPISGKIILAPRLFNGFSDNFGLAATVIHEMDHYCNWKLGILQGNSYIANQLNELSAYNAAAKWTGYMETTGIRHGLNVANYFLKFSH
jgi:hypothetical protein